MKIGNFFLSEFKLVIWDKVEEDGGRGGYSSHKIRTSRNSKILRDLVKETMLSMQPKSRVCYAGGYGFLTSVCRPLSIRHPSRNDKPDGLDK